MFRLGYNTNGLAHHRVDDALRLCAELGYEAVSITPDAGLLDPFRLSADEVGLVRQVAEDLGLELTVETGSRFLLDPARKHRPNLLEQDRAERGQRVAFLERCVDLAADLGASIVSFWAGCAPDGRTVGDAVDSDAASADTEPLWERLVVGTRAVLARGRDQGVQIAFEPEPGMFIERPAGYRELLARLGSGAVGPGLCLDVGHLLCTGDLPVGRVIREFADELALVHLDDIKDGVHEHRMFGEGDLDLAETLGALIAVGFDGVAAVELSRDAHRGPEAARQALGHLRLACGLPGDPAPGPAQAP